VSAACSTRGRPVGRRDDARRRALIAADASRLICCNSNVFPTPHTSCSLDNPAPARVAGTAFEVPDGGLGVG